MSEVTFETKLRWELRKSIARIHFDPGVITTASVRWLESAVVGWAVEGHKFVYTVADAIESTT